MGADDRVIADHQSTLARQVGTRVDEDVVADLNVGVRAMSKIADQNSHMLEEDTIGPENNPAIGGCVRMPEHRNARINSTARADSIEPRRSGLDHLRYP